MRLVRFNSESGARVGAVRSTPGGRLDVVDLVAHDALLPTSVKALLAGDPSLSERASAAAGEGTGTPFDEVELLPPIDDPQKIVCVGLNYADHAKETGATPGDEPVIFCKFPTTLCASHAAIELPPESQQVDFEAELVVVIGRMARRVSREQAWRHIAGYCCGNDVSARDWQKHKPGKQWLLGKSFDSFAPLGPWIATPDEIGDPHRLPIELRLNGEVMQQSNTSQLIFQIDYLVSYLSHVCTLLPGDLIFTGTPSGVGMARTPPVFLKDGDVVEVAIEGLGSLRNPVASTAS